MTSLVNLVHFGIRNWDPLFLYQVGLDEIVQFDH